MATHSRFDSPISGEPKHRESANLAGRWFEGCDAFAKSLESLHSEKVKESGWRTEQVRVRFLSPSICCGSRVFQHKRRTESGRFGAATAARGFYARRREARRKMPNRRVAADQHRCAGDGRVDVATESTEWLLAVDECVNGLEGFDPGLSNDSRNMTPLPGRHERRETGFWRASASRSAF